MDDTVPTSFVLPCNAYTVGEQSIRWSVVSAATKMCASATAVDAVAFIFPRIALYGIVPLLGTAFLCVKVTRREQDALRLQLGQNSDLFFFLAAMVVSILGLVVLSKASA